MSLLYQNKAFSVWDYLFLAAGILGGLWFFLSYSSQDPRSLMQTSLDENSAAHKAAEVLNSLGYATGNLNTDVEYRVNGNLLDSLQSELGRARAILVLQDSVEKQLHPFYWQVRFSKGEEFVKMRIESSGDKPVLGLRLNHDGQWFELVNSGQKLPAQTLNRKALQYAFKEDGSRELWKSVPDSAWKGILNFDVKNGYDLSRQGEPEEEKDESNAHTFSLNEVKRLGEYYLNASAWNPDEFNLENIEFITLGNSTGAKLHYKNSQPFLGQQVSLKMTLLPTGALIGLEATYNPSAREASSPNAWSLISLIAIFIFGLTVIVIFFDRR